MTTARASCPLKAAMNSSCGRSSSSGSEQTWIADIPRASWLDSSHEVVPGNEHCAMDRCFCQCVVLPSDEQTPAGGQSFDGHRLPLAALFLPNFLRKFPSISQARSKT